MPDTTKPRIYIETTIVSYLTAWRSPQLLMAAQQEATRTWWDHALHIATAAVHGMDYLLTWNCRHIANATLRTPMSIICESAEYAMPVICTPLELTEALKDD